MENLSQTSQSAGSARTVDASLISRRHVGALVVLQIVFVARVGAQFVQSRLSLGWLPNFDAFQSGALPYRTLAAGQLAIIGLQSWVVVGVAVQRRILSGMARSMFGSLALVYFLTMLGRLIVGSTVAQGHSWLDNPVPSTFHLVLASFVGVWVHYSTVMENV